MFEDARFVRKRGGSLKKPCPANMPEVANTPDFLWMSSEKVAEQGYEAVMSGKNLIINGWLNKFFALISMIIPKILTKSVGKYLTKKRMPN